MQELDIIRPKKLCSILDIHISTLYRWMDQDKLPIEKIQFGPRAVGFRKSDVEAWLNGELEDEPQSDVA
ncbi:MAG: helix-turn-helix domain-containing protein [Balneolaceae bacterium]|nr:helix-turn-helix domain-containing protein [Balneolaceae bacterium]